MMFGMDPKALFGDDADAFAKELQQAATGGQFNPMAMFSGNTEFHSCFLGPLTPQIQQGIEAFLADGSGPLSSIVKDIQAADPEVSQLMAMQRAQDLLRNAQGYCVIILANDQGLVPLSHLFFGSLPDEFIEALAEQCKAHQLDETVAAQLRVLRDKVSTTDIAINECFVCDEYEDSDEYWIELGERLCEGIDEGIIPLGQQQLSELGYWIAGGIALSAADELDGDELLVHARCCALAGELDAAINSLDHMLNDYEPDEEELVPVCEQLGQVAVRSGQGQKLEACFAKHQESLGASYEIALLRFKLLASSNSKADALMPAAQRLYDCDAKSCRHDLNKEAVWIIFEKPMRHIARHSRCR